MLVENQSVLMEALRVSEEELRAQAEELAEAQFLVSRERQRYQDLFEHAPVPYIVTDAHGTMRVVNRSAANLLRCRADRLLGKPLASFIPMRTRGTFRQHVHRARSGTEPIPVLLRICPRVGSECVVVGTLAPVMEDGNVTELRWLIAPKSGGTDALTAAEQRLAESEAARVRAQRYARETAELLAWASHELRTPAASIGGYADILTMGVRGMLTPDQQAILVRIQQAQSHLVALLEDLVTFARAGSGHLRYDISDVPLEPIVERLLAIVEPQAAARDLRLTIQVPQNIVVRGDAERVLQILLNLVTNAVKFTPASGSVQVTCDPDGDMVMLHVRDTGPGVPEEAHERIFRPYVQLDTRSDYRVKGAGLGLAISRELARAMGGDLSCVSSRDGASVFVLRLPRSTRIAAAASGP